MLILLSLSSYLSYATTTWKKVAPGIEYIDANDHALSPWSHIHVFRVNLNFNKFDIALAKSINKKNASVDELSLYHQALIAINGGFFDYHFRPLGLRIGSEGQISPVKNISWWGIFYIKNNKPFITTVRNFKPSNQIQFAVQSGPRLLVQNQPLALKEGTAERTALGITKDKKVLILVTENHPLTTTNLALLLKRKPFSCTHALNLDGGSSSQLRANFTHLQINLHGFSNISDAIIVQGIDNKT